ncbi:hypothetical protein JW992_08285 [candidate division KSB1 bacterium]|nr:hypothetical protein [candidate division KSB1 bacterium]
MKRLKKYWTPGFFRRFAFYSLIVWGCGFYFSCSNPGTYSTATIPLTSQLIKEYKLTPQDLMQMKYYLTEELTLIGQLNLTVKKLDKKLGLEVYKTKDQEVIVLRRNTPGVASYVVQEPLVKIGRVKLFMDKLKITVCFSRYTDACLVFIPTEAGSYVLETDKRDRVKFCGGTYKVLKSHRPTSLNVVIKDAQVRKKMQKLEVPGRDLQMP